MIRFRKILTILYKVNGKKEVNVIVGNVIVCSWHCVIVKANLGATKSKNFSRKKQCYDKNWAIVQRTMIYLFDWERRACRVCHSESFNFFLFWDSVVER